MSGDPYYEKQGGKDCLPYIGLCHSFMIDFFIAKDTSKQKK